jgi:MBG domain (YGX type)
MKTHILAMANFGPRSGHADVNRQLPWLGKRPHRGQPYDQTGADDNGNASSHAADSPYAITAVDTDYSISYLAGAPTLTSARLTITADNLLTSYGVPNPSLTFVVSGLVNEAKADAVLSGATTTSASSSYHVCNYNITQGTFASNTDYQISGSVTRVTMHLLA